MTKVSKRDALLGSRVALIQTTNPKKSPSMSYDRYNVLIAQCANGATPTVGELLKAGYRMDDVRHDEERGYIAIGDDDIKAVEAKRVADRAAAIEAARKLVEEADAEVEVEEPAE
jgi:hypothetical protein